MTGLLAYGEEQFNATRLALVTAFAVAFLIDHQQHFDGMLAQSAIDKGEQYLRGFTKDFPQAVSLAGMGTTLLKYCQLYLIDHSEDAGFSKGRALRQPGALLCARCQVNVLAMGANNRNPKYSGGAFCDDCQANLPTSTMYSCYPCTSDVCPGCYEKRMDQVAVKCSRCTTRVLVRGANESNPVYAGSASCDDCQASIPTSEAYSCAPCTADLCLFCYQTRRYKMPSLTTGEHIPRVPLREDAEQQQQQQAGLIKLRSQLDELQRKQFIENQIQDMELRNEKAKHAAFMQKLAKEAIEQEKLVQSENQRVLFVQGLAEEKQQAIAQKLHDLSIKQQHLEELAREQELLASADRKAANNLTLLQNQLRSLRLLQLQQQQMQVEQERSNQEREQELVVASEVFEALQELPTQRIQQRLQRQTQMRLQLQKELQQEALAKQREKEREQEKLQERLLHQEHEKQQRITDMLALERERQRLYVEEAALERLREQTPPPSPLPSPSPSPLHSPMRSPTAQPWKQEIDPELALAIELSMRENLDSAPSPANSRNSSAAPSPQGSPLPTTRTPQGRVAVSPAVTPLSSPRLVSLGSPRVSVSPSPRPAPPRSNLFSLPTFPIPPVPTPAPIPTLPTPAPVPTLPPAPVPTLTPAPVPTPTPAPVPTPTPAPAAAMGSGACSELYCSCKVFKPQKWDANKCNSCMHWKAKHSVNA